jgi:hypothetical protein
MTARKLLIVKAWTKNVPTKLLIVDAWADFAQVFRHSFRVRRTSRTATRVKTGLTICDIKTTLYPT